MNITLCVYFYCTMVSVFTELEENGINLIEFTQKDHDKTNPNPVNKIFFDAAEAIRKNLRKLGLTLSTLVTSDDHEVSDLINEVNSVE